MPGVRLPRTAEDFAALESLARYSAPSMAQPINYESLLRGLPVGLEGDIRQPTVVGNVPLHENALLKLRGRPMGENPFAFAELLGRF